MASACQPTRYLSEKEVLYYEDQIVWEGAAPAISKDALTTSIKQQPNARFLGKPVRLGLYLRNEEREKGFGKWVRERLGEAPVFYDASDAQQSLLLLQKRLIDEGYLQADGRMDTTMLGPHRAKVAYYLQAGARYYIDSINWPSDTTALGRLIMEAKPGTNLKTSVPYRTNNLQRERSRLADYAAERGYYGISPAAFYYFLDTARTDYRSTLYLRIAEPPSGQDYQRHYMGATVVHPGFYLNASDTLPPADTSQVAGLRLVRPNNFVAPEVLATAILQDSGELYQQRLNRQSVNRLFNLGTYQFVNLKYETRRAGDSLYLDRYFFLTPALTQDFSAELETSSLTSSTNSLAMGLNLRYAHRNLFGGAERLDTRLSSGIETQLGRRVSFINTFNMSAEAELSFPDFLVPIGAFQPGRPWQSRTVLQLQGLFQRRTNAFTLASVQGKVGYRWQPNELQSQQWYPFQLELVNLIDATDDFRQSIDNNPRLRESFSNYLIAGMGYRFNYSEENPGKRDNYLAVRTHVEPAGNLAYLTSALARGNSEEPYQIFGLPFAQFFRTEADIKFHRFRRKTDWLLRTNIGVAIPYGNANTVPFIKQFFVGGSNSIRAWQIRTLGPGSSDAGLEQTTAYNDQTGDIKLELNAEYRFPVFSFLKGAFFVDAGNIWLLPSGSEGDVEETLFRWDRFYQEIAVGAGTGLRVDLTYFVLRVDVAVPIRKPYLPNRDRWVVSEPGFASGDWWGNNLNWNLAIGYPF